VTLCERNRQVAPSLSRIDGKKKGRGGEGYDVVKEFWGTGGRIDASGQVGLPSEGNSFYSGSLGFCGLGLLGEKIRRGEGKRKVVGLPRKKECEDERLPPNSLYLYKPTSLLQNCREGGKGKRGRDGI